MIPEVQRVARHIHQQYPEHAQALIERWLPENEVPWLAGYAWMGWDAYRAITRRYRGG